MLKLCAELKTSQKGAIKLTIGLLPRSSSPEPEPNPGRPGAPLKQQDGEDDAKGKTKGGADEEGGEGVIPLFGAGEVSQALCPFTKGEGWDGLGWTYVDTMGLRTFSLSRASLTGRCVRTVDGEDGEVSGWDILCRVVGEVRG